MKRDWDLIRKILIEVEGIGDTKSLLQGVDGFDDETSSYHIRLLIEAGLIQGNCHQGIGGPLKCTASSLTWSGHEFLDKVRSATMWNKVKEIAREKSLPMSFDVIKAAAGMALASIFGK